MPNYTSQYPPAHSDTYVKATSIYGARFEQYLATDPALSLTGNDIDKNWICSNGVYTNQRFHIDLGSGKVIKRIYYENFHNAGFYTDRGPQNFTFWGSNTEASFLELTYATDTGWTQITTAQGTFDEHTGSDVADPKYITVTNSTAYQYYAFKFADTRLGSGYMGLRHVVLQTEDAVTVNSIFFGANF